MSQLTNIPYELLVEICTLEISHRKLTSANNPDTKQETAFYISYFNSRKINISIYRAAQEAFWKTYIAKVQPCLTYRLLHGDELVASLEKNQCSDKAMIARCRNLKMTLTVKEKAVLWDGGDLRVYKGKLMEYLGAMVKLRRVCVVLILRKNVKKDAADAMIEEMRDGLGKWEKKVDLVVIQKILSSKA